MASIERNPQSSRFFQSMADQYSKQCDDVVTFINTESAPLVLLNENLIQYQADLNRLQIPFFSLKRMIRLCGSSQEQLIEANCRTTLKNGVDVALDNYDRIWQQSQRIHKFCQELVDIGCEVHGGQMKLRGLIGSQCNPHQTSWEQSVSRKIGAIRFVIEKLDQLRDKLLIPIKKYYAHLLIFHKKLNYGLELLGGLRDDRRGKCPYAVTFPVPSGFDLIDPYDSKGDRIEKGIACPMLLDIESSEYPYLQGAISQRVEQNRLNMGQHPIEGGPNIQISTVELKKRLDEIFQDLQKNKPRVGFDLDDEKSSLLQVQQGEESDS